MIGPSMCIRSDVLRITEPFIALGLPKSVTIATCLLPSQQGWQELLHHVGVMVVSLVHVSIPLPSPPERRAAAGPGVPKVSEV